MEVSFRNFLYDKYILYRAGTKPGKPLMIEKIFPVVVRDPNAERSQLNNFNRGNVTGLHETP